MSSEKERTSLGAGFRLKYKKRPVEKQVFFYVLVNYKLFRNINCSRFSDYCHFYLTRISHFGLYFLRDIK